MARERAKSEPQFPVVAEDQEVPVRLAAFTELEKLDDLPQGIVALTDGWTQGPVAAVLRGGVNAQAALDLMRRAGLTEIDIFHLEEKVEQLEEVFLSSVVAHAHELFESVNVHWRRDPGVVELVRSIGSRYRTLFFGAPLARSEIAPFQQRLRQVYDGGIVVVRGPVSDVEFDEGDEVYKWVRERTFDASDFSASAVLRNLKRKQGAKVAILLPSLNEEQTVGEVIAAALEVKKAGLADEVILVDSDSTDRTVEITRARGVPVHLHREIRPELGSYHGKGEAMFKSAFVTDADILAWVDTDIASITPRFFYGLLGPLFTYPDVDFVKGYFMRPVTVEPTGVELGGGRVTEILVRPWLNAFLPQLAGYIQPLAGTVAIRRSLFRKMKIPTNYGVEIAMLVQAVTEGGLWSTCQVNLGEVIHRSKNVAQLSEMSFQILQVLRALTEGEEALPRPGVLHRVFSAQGAFAIGMKRFETHWRRFNRSAYPPKAR
ncbi:MAG TPA: glucosyl-3-phosphoglycerate synthase [Firmicutes bacterium]|nr:glucosyl-3-phosphoglycerate synthase [Bacillota bacterium]